MPTPIIWTPEMDDALTKARAAGLPFKDCAARIGVDWRVARSRAWELHGVTVELNRAAVKRKR